MQPWQHAAGEGRIIELPLHDKRWVRSSSGHAEERLVVVMDVRLAGKTVPAEVTLTSRDEMAFRMLIGREALQKGFLVDSGASFLGGKPPREIRRRNRGREPRP